MHLKKSDAAQNKNIQRRDDSMFISVIIATKDRREDLKRLCKSLSNQTMLPDELLIVDSGDHVGLLSVEGINANHIFTDQKGLTVQRNIGIKNTNKNADIIFFFDDDIVLEDDYIEIIVNIFKEDIDYKIGGVDGFPLQDGKMLYSKNDAYEITPVKSLYGCNMAFRVAAIKNLWFDEKLSLYGWLEDWDFSTAVSKNYKLLRCNQAYCYHMQSQDGRINGKKLGYMQIANRHYLNKKHGLDTKSDLLYFVKQTLLNLIRSYKHSYFDRFRGNAKAFFNVVILGKDI
jgi:glycosyltransferase involved in cell wall biosynthesis